jgi:O-antigen ligase
MESRNLEKAQQRQMVPPLEVAGAWTARHPGAAGPDRAETKPLRAGQATASLTLFSIVLILFAVNQHELPPLPPSLAVVLVRGLVPLAAAGAVALFPWRPMASFTVVLALTPVWNAAQMELTIGSFQVIGQTVFVAAMIGGCVTLVATGWTAREPAPDREFDHFAAWERIGTDRTVAAGAVRRGRRNYRAYHFVELAAAGFVAIAVASTFASRDVATSANVLVHGIVEPLVMAAILVWLRPGRRALILVGAALAFAAAFATALNILQGLSAYGSFQSMLAHRLYFSWYTYGNVGFFGLVVAATIQIEVGLLLARHRLGLSRQLTALLLVAIALTLTGLFFTISKSAWLSATAAAAILAPLAVRSRRRRAAAAVAAIALSAVFVPWPTLLLQATPAASAAYRTAIVQVVGSSRLNSWDIDTLAGHGSMAERYYALEGGVRMALDHPVLGVGLDQFSRYYVRGQYRPAQAHMLVDHAHSLFPEVAAELGLLAAVLLALLILGTMWAMWRAWRTARSDLSRAMAASILAAVTAWVTGAILFGCYFYRPFNLQASDVATFAVLVGMAVALARLRTREGSAWD